MLKISSLHHRRAWQETAEQMPIRMAGFDGSNSDMMVSASAPSYTPTKMRGHPDERLRNNMYDADGGMATDDENIVISTSLMGMVCRLI